MIDAVPELAMSSDKYIKPEWRMGLWMPASWPRHQVWIDMLICPFCGAGVREIRKGKHMLKVHKELDDKVTRECNRLNRKELDEKGDQ